MRESAKTESAGGQPGHGDGEEESSVGHDYRERTDGATHAYGVRVPGQMWLAVACLCLVAATAFWWRGNADAAFVAAALGIVSWFLNVRVKLRPKFDQNGADGSDVD